MIEVSESDLIELLNGRRPEIEVGSFPAEVKKHLGCSRDTVFLTTPSLKHIFERHGDHVSPKEILYLPSVLLQGLWLADTRPNFVLVSGLYGNTRYKVAIKTTEDRRRNYIATFHRIAKKQTKSLLKKGKVLRPAW